MKAHPSRPLHSIPVGRRQLLQMSALGALMATRPFSAFAQDVKTYPDRPVTVVSPFTPGGLNDICSRAISRGLQDDFGRPVVVENRPGANTLIGLQHVLQQPADGHTLVAVSDANMTYLPALASNLSFDLENAFTPVTLVCTVPMVLVVRPGLEVETTADLIGLLEADPDDHMTFASAGVGTGPHISGELFKLLTNANLDHIPYQGAAAAMTAVLAGHVDICFIDVGTASEMLRAGNLRAIGISTKARSPLFSDIPPVADAGLPDFDVNIWIGICVRAGTPANIVDLLNQKIVAALQRPDIAEAITRTGAQIVTNTPDEFAEMISADRARFGELIRSTGIKIEL